MSDIIDQARAEVAEDRRIAGLMHQPQNRELLLRRADITERLADTIETYRDLYGPAIAGDLRRVDGSDD